MELTAKHFTRAFAVFAVVALAIFALLVPPFENPDEFNHANRADLLANLRLVATRYGGPDTSGGKVDSGLTDVQLIIGTIRFHPERKVTPPMLAAARAVRWDHRLGWRTFDNTAIYPPVFYAPAALGIRLGKALDLSVVHTLILSRLLTGLTSIAIASAAIAIAGAAAPWLFTILCLPTSLSLFASVSQDGPMIGAAALAVGCVVRLARSPTDRTVALLCLALGLVVMARPPYAPLAAIPLLLPIPWRGRLLAALAIILPAIAWSALTAALTIINTHAADGVHPATQLHLLLTRPQRWLPLARGTYAHQGLEGLPYRDEFIGVLGWLDVRLPAAYYRAATLILVVALIASCPANRILPIRERAALSGALIASSLAIFVFEYASFTAVGADRVVGVQGRYFIPVALFLPAVLPAVRLPRALATASRSLLLAFPILSIVIAARVMAVRYYP